MTSRKALPKHTNGCPKWGEVYPETSPSEFNFDAYYRTGFWVEGYVEGVDYVRCRICAEQGVDFRKRRILSHVKNTHHKTKAEYLSLYPEAFTSCSETNRLRRATVQERYGVDNVFQAEEVKASFDVRETAWNPETRQKRAETNLGRYGHVNPLGGEQGAERMRQGMLEAHGVENAAHLEEVQEKKRQTNLERYGVEWTTQVEAFQEKARQTCMERYGSDHYMKTEEGQAHLREVFLERYGTENLMRVPEIREKIRQTCRARYGSDTPLGSSIVKEKIKSTLIRRYGVTNPAHMDDHAEKTRQTWMENYGVPFPPQSIRNTFECPNKLEQRVAALSDRLLFTGDGAVWFRFEEQDRNKNPDFIVIPDDPEGEIKKVIEVQGDYWHGEEMTGESPEEHDARIRAGYAAHGVEVLFIWESEMGDEESVRARLEEFLTPVKREEEPSSGQVLEYVRELPVPDYDPQADVAVGRRMEARMKLAPLDLDDDC